ncbi:uracil phosphoribosyltransferase [Flavobacterium sp. LS1R49]|uniref:Uracil phosphoribosyltransferase n=1 Tax=Flavobacterium shii TaxID=2987687 RepID=A0A9X3BZR4_9FLAO|nr:uracil phosphoribosyltransferase [Flavobacterium shii]MCV9929711.1 uracil phosphoribosyltransferase [Flavobacterium shii]
MTTFFEGIQYLFVNILFAPLDFLRSLELVSWFGANTINWIFMIICASAMVYWIKQLRIFDAQGTENQDTTAHSFLK